MKGFKYLGCISNVEDSEVVFPYEQNKEMKVSQADVNFCELSSLQSRICKCELSVKFYNYLEEFIINIGTFNQFLTNFGKTVGLGGVIFRDSSHKNVKYLRGILRKLTKSSHIGCVPLEGRKFTLYGKSGGS